MDRRWRGLLTGEFAVGHVEYIMRNRRRLRRSVDVSMSEVWIHCVDLMDG